MKFRFFIIVLLILKTGISYPQADSATITKVDKLFDSYLDLMYNSPDTAFLLLDSIEIISATNNYDKGYALALREKGMFYSLRGDFVKAMVFMDSALHVDEKINDKEGIASDLLFLGLNFFDQGKTEEALDYLPRAREIYTEMNDEEGIALINSNLGMVYRNLDQFELALQHYNYTYDLYSQEGYESNRAHVDNNIGNLYKDLQQYDVALEYLFRSKALKTELNMEFSLMPTISNIGDIYLEQGRINEAIEYYDQAMQIANKQNAMVFRKDISLDLSKAYEKLGDEPKALGYFKDYSRLKDSLLSEDFNNDLANMKIKYESDKKEKENLVLSKENELKEANIQKEKNRKYLFAAISGIVLLLAVILFIQFRNKKKLNANLEKINQKINNQNSTLKTLNKNLIESEENLLQTNQTKDQLISMISHDLYNPVTAISNYTKQISESPVEMSQKELNSSFSKVNNAIIPLKDLLDNILQWAQFQKGNITPRMEEVDVCDIINEITDLYQPGAALKDVKIVKTNTGNLIVTTDRLMLHFILRNLLNNAVKFTSSGSSIHIEAKENPENIAISISDEGSGFDNKILTILNDNNQKDKLIATDGSGVGLSTSRQFIDLLKGTLRVTNNKTGGATVSISLPKN